MKRVAVFVLSLLLAASIAQAQTTTDDDRLDLNELRAKIVRMKKDINKLMKEIVTVEPGEESWMAPVIGQDVKIDVIENDKEMVVKADLPGMDKDKIDIVLEKGKILKISGSREIVKEEKVPGMVRQERSSGKFERVIELPTEGMIDGINASYKSGVLEIVIPKKQTMPEEKVKIKVL